jgi:phosphoheptose isomerase
MSREMITQTVEIIQEALKQDKHINVIINNRSGGNAPLIAREVARQFLGGTNS